MGNENELQWAGFLTFCSHSSGSQATSYIIASLNATPVVYYRYQLVVSISFTIFRITKVSWPKKLDYCSRYWNTMDHWVGHNKYIKTLLIWLHLIFIYIRN